MAPGYQIIYYYTLCWGLISITPTVHEYTQILPDCSAVKTDFPMNFHHRLDGNNWINNIINGISAWRAVTLVELRNRSDTGQANRSPQTTILPALRWAYSLFLSPSDPSPSTPPNTNAQSVSTCASDIPSMQASFSYIRRQNQLVSRLFLIKGSFSPFLSLWMFVVNFCLN